MFVLTKTATKLLISCHSGKSGVTKVQNHAQEAEVSFFRRGGAFPRAGCAVFVQ